jgi:1,2-diacylglycerol 3-alpha-glucosyltransferase
MEPMKKPTHSIALVNDGYVPIMDGVTITVQNYGYWLTQLGNRSCVIVPEVPGYQDEDIFPILRYASIPIPTRPPYRLGLPSLDLTVKKLIKQQKFSLVHVHSPFAAGRLARWIADEYQIPLVATFHSKYRDDFQQQFKIESLVDFIIKEIIGFYHSADEVWVPQESVAQTLRSYGFRGNYHVMPNGTDMEMPEDISEHRRSGESFLGINTDDILGLYVGQHIREKNLESVISSLPEIVKHQDNFKMVFVGTGYYKSEMIKTIETWNLRSKVLFIDPIYDRQLLATIYGRADIFMFPSLYDNTPLVIREAAALQTPSLLVKGSDAAEPVTDGVNGFLCDGTPKGIADKVLEVASNPRCLQEAGKAAQKTIPITWKEAVQQAADRYTRIVENYY